MARELSDHRALLPVGLDESDWADVQRRVRGLEVALRACEVVDLAAFLPPVESRLRLPALLELVKFDQEFRWRLGRPAPLEEYLRRWPELTADEAILDELVEAECLTRAMVGDVPGQDEVQARFPENLSALDLLNVLRTAAQPEPVEPSKIVLPPRGRARPRRRWLLWVEAAAVALLMAALALLLRG